MPGSRCSLALVAALGLAAPAAAQEGGIARGGADSPSPEPLPDYFKTGVLDREARLWAQARIERVWYAHRIWPKENPRPKPPFEEMAPRALIERKAAEPLRMAAALKKFWNLEITPPMLQAELDRMERESRDRATLHELFAALRDDPFLIAETIARPILTERALRHHYAWDPALHSAEASRAAAAGRRLKAGADWSEFDAVHSRQPFTTEAPSHRSGLPRSARDHLRALTIPRSELDELRNLYSGPAEFREEENGWSALRIVTGEAGGLEMESLVIEKTPFASWWTAQAVESGELNWSVIRRPYTLPEPARTAALACDQWTGTLKEPPAGLREGHTAVWTGTEMIIWGGIGMAGHLNSGSRYNPASDEWRATSVGANLPAGRQVHTAIWTGSEMIIWGGWGIGGNFNSGGRYDPVADSWRPTATDTGVPSARGLHTAVWTGSEMIVWGGIYSASTGSTLLNSGGRYDPAADSWTPTALDGTTPAPRGLHTAIWTGREMIVWGGSGRNTGGRYDPITDSWRPTSVGTNVPTVRHSHTAVWTGNEMIVWGGSGLNTGGRYDPLTDTWRATSAGANIPSGRSGHAAVWTGSEMIVWGGLGTGGYFNSGGRYDPATDSWRATPVTSATAEGRVLASAVWTGGELIVWGGFDGNYPLSTGGRYNPASDSWTPTYHGEPFPHERYLHSAVWTGAEMIVWGGFYNFTFYNNGGRYTPATASWTAMSTGPNPLDGQVLHAAVWTGREMIVWGGYRQDAVTTQVYFSNTGGRYNPASDAWQPTSLGSGVPSGREGAAAVWTGTEMIVWGGDTFDLASGVTSAFNTGGRYNPATDAWTPTSTGANVPSPRDSVAVWTGREMIVWGGSGNCLSPSCPPGFNDGGRYDPSRDSWIAIPAAAGAPSPRSAHSLVWTGAEMIVWGGEMCGPTTCVYLNDGARYNPAANQWTPLSALSAPSPRAIHTAIWTGSEMIVWGGYFDSATGPYYQPLNTGGRYSPASDRWLPASTGPYAASPRYGHTAVWTGSEMIVWGGLGEAFLNIGGAYASGAAASPGGTLRGAKAPRAVVFNWDPSAGADFYNVLRCSAAAGGCLPTQVVANPTTPTYGERDNGRSRFYAVEAVNACGATP